MSDTPSHTATTTRAPPGVNDNNLPAPNTIAFSDLALAMQVYEDVLLRRLAKILRKREAKAGAVTVGDLDAAPSEGADG